MTLFLSILYPVRQFDLIIHLSSIILLSCVRKPCQSLDATRRGSAGSAQDATGTRAEPANLMVLILL